MGESDAQSMYSTQYQSETNYKLIIQYRTSMIYTSNDIIMGIGPVYLSIPSYLMDYSANISVMEPHFWHISDLIQISVVPTERGDGIQSCMTYNPPGKFKPGYGRDKSVSSARIF